MVTPHDIATKNFKKVAVGYSPEEVDIFLDDIYEDYEKLYLEHKERKKMPMPEPISAPVPEPEPYTAPIPTPAPTPIQEDAEHIQKLEKALERTLTLAETAAEETKQAARAEAEQIVAQAKLERDEILANARTKAYELEQQIDALQNRYELMRTRVKLLLYAEIELLDKNEILAEKEAEHETNE